MSSSTQEHISRSRWTTLPAAAVSSLTSSSIVALAVVLALVSIFNFLTLLHPIEAHYDDAWYASRAWAVIHTGYAFGPLDQGVLTNFDGYWTYFWLAATWVDSLFVRVFGPTLLAVRLSSFVFGIALLCVVYSIASRLATPRVGLLAVVIGSFSLPFMYSSHVGRSDIIVATLGFGALALYFSQGTAAFSAKSVFTGLALGIAFDIHPTSVIYIPVIGALLLFDYKLTVLRAGRTWGFLLGLLCGFAYFAAVHILPYPQTYFAISHMQQGTDVTTPPITVLNPEVWLRSLFYVLSLLGPLTLGLLVVAVGILLYKPTRTVTRILLAFGVLVLSFAAIVPLKPIYYAILIAPFSWLLIATAANKVTKSLVNWDVPRKAVLRITALSSILVLLTVPNLPFLLQNSYPDYEAALQLIQRTAPPGTSIIGNQTYWFARPDQPYYAWEQLAYYRRYYPDSTLADAIRGLHVDYVVMDGLTDNFLTNDPTLLYSNIAVPQTQLRSFLDGHTSLVAEGTNATYGYIRIYKINK
jgi:4-amino-4-deoxy-L-arabinose transferase-like glycosyltransferase